MKSISKTTLSHALLRQGGNNSMKMSRILISFLLPLVALFLMSGCATRSTHHSSSVVKYLYPDKNEPVETSQIPSLSLPLKVGVAFVPETDGRNYGFTEKEKARLLKEISGHFKKYEFVKSIDILPSAYLTPAGSFANLDQISTMYGIDVIALVSYDQAQFTDEGLASISYWTLVGAYIVPGEKNDTHTMIDAAVYDIKSRKMLFRAPGISNIKGRATPVNLSEQLREDSMDGFKVASEDMVNNLSEQLELFREKVKEAPQEYQINHKPGYVGGGSLDAVFLISVLIMSGCWVWVSRYKSA